MSVVTESAFNTLMAAVNSPLIVVTTAVDDERGGCVVGFHSQSSIGPQHYSLWLSKANHTYVLGLRARHFAVHFLTSEDMEIAELFGGRSGKDTDKFAGLDLDIDDTGLPLLRQCPNRMVLERLAMLDDGGDHVCVTTRAVSAEGEGEFVPLRAVDLAHLDPGHSSEERAIRP